ncbi:hypothetical protein Tco_1308940 [Tanacetum coccineum]
MKVCPILREVVSWKLGGDVESLRDELAKLKLAKEVLFCPCGVVAIMEAKGKMILDNKDNSLVFGVFKLMKCVSEDPSYITGGELEYPRELFLGSRSFGSAVLGQMTYLVASSTLDSARSYVMQGAPFTQGTIPSIPIGGSISLEGFLSSILLLVVIIVTVLIVAVILVVVVIAIVGVVIVVVIIGVVFVVGVPIGPVFLLGLLALAIVAACAFRAEEIPSVINCWMAVKVMAGVSDVDVLLGGILST